MNIVIVGANGQLGRALQQRLPDATALTRAELDVTNAAAVAGYDWSGTDAIINAAAYTKVDAAELPENYASVQAVNVEAVRHLADASRRHDLCLVHVSSEYVFDGDYRGAIPEDLPFSPQSVYGQSKADGDRVAMPLTRHYLVRPTWVVGDGSNFVRTMVSLAGRGISPSVVGDQVGRLTFADDLAAGILHLLMTKPRYGTYNLTNTGDAVPWVDVARAVYGLCGRDPRDVGETTSAEYFAGKAAARRPANSLLDLSKVEATGFRPRDWRLALTDYIGNAG